MTKKFDVAAALEFVFLCILTVLFFLGIFAFVGFLIATAVFSWQDHNSWAIASFVSALVSLIVTLLIHLVGDAIYG